MNQIKSDNETSPSTTSPEEPSEEDERDTTSNWIPLTVLIIAVPFMLALFVAIGYLVCEWRHPG